MSPAPVTRGRGRPYRPPVDASAWRSVSGGVAARTAWLLGTSRMMRAGGAYANRQDFLPELADLGVRADNSRVSRWESGTGAITREVVEAYEQILELPRQALAAPISLLDPRAGRVIEVSPGTDPAALDRFVEAVLTGETAEGHRWADLARELAQHPSIYLRSTLWRELATRLVTELSRSVGVAYAARLAALHQLIAHPMAHNDVLAAIGQYVTDPYAVRVRDVIAALAQAPSSGGRFLALGLLSSGDPELQAGAARAITAMQAAQSWSASLDAELERSTLALLAAETTPTGNADLLTYLAADARERVMAELGDSYHHRFVVEHATLTSPATASLIAANVASRAQASVDAAANPDPMLERLVREALFHGHAERRHRAEVLLMASPFSAGIASAVAGLLNADDPLIAHRAAVLLRYCVTPAETDDILAAPRNRPPVVEGAALCALGHVQSLEEADVDHLLDRSTAWPDDDRTDAAVYVLGMHGLTDKISGTTVPDHVASACQWWRRIGSRIAV